MVELVYSVVATFPDPDAVPGYLDWLTGGHVQAVLAGGATSAAVTALDDGTSVESRYVFPDREAFAAYERGPALALRDDGSRRFPPESGVRFTRTVGTLVAGLP